MSEFEAMTVDDFVGQARAPYHHHRCGRLLNDWKGNSYEVPRICGFGNCSQYFCPGCGRYTGGFGPVGCPCEEHPSGHSTYAEFARPSLAHLRKHRTPRNRRWR